MDADSFRTRLHEEGFDEVDLKSLGANLSAAEHRHDFEVLALVMAGQLTLTVAGVATTYREGEIFALEAFCPHEELYGPEGVTYLVGRKRLASQARAA